MKLYEIVFSFLDPSRASGQILADSPKKAIEKIKADIEENCPNISGLTIDSIREIADNLPENEDISENRTLN